MNKLTFLFLFLTLGGISSYAQHTDPLEVYYFDSSKESGIDQLAQNELSRSPAWENFEERHGSWYVEFNEWTGLPHRAFGSPIKVDLASGYVHAARQFLLSHFEQLGISAALLGEADIFEREKFTSVLFKQEYQGHNILFSRASVRFNKDGNIYLFSLDIHPDIDLKSGKQLNIDELSARAAADMSSIDMKVSSIGQETIIAVPDYGTKSYDYRLCQEIILSNSEEVNEPKEYRSYVDVETGKTIYRLSEIQYCGHEHEEHSTPDHKMTAKASTSARPVWFGGNIYPTHVYDPAAIGPMQYVQTTVGGQIQFADSLGYLVLPDTGIMKVNLRGPYSQVWDARRGDLNPSFVFNLKPQSDSVKFDTAANMSIRHLTAYHHTNLIHDQMRTWFTQGVTGLDSPLITRVDRTDGSCNAFYRGNENSINFYITSNGCNALSQVADVVYHEYGHAINRNRYGGDGERMTHGGLNEGYADVWALATSKTEVLGIGFYTNSNQRYVRRYDTTTKVYPQNYVNQVHNDGEIICGAWTELRRRVGIPKMMQLFTKTYDAQPVPDGPTGSLNILGQIYRDVLIEALIADDNDGDLSNGTPNIDPILASFARHGIYLVERYSISHKPVDELMLTEPLNIEAEIVRDSFLNLPARSFALYPYIYYKESSDQAWNKALLQKTQGNKYTVSLAAPSHSALIEYYISMEDSAGVAYTTLPDGVSEPNNSAPPFYTLYGYSRVMLEDYEAPAPGFGMWTTPAPGDNATEGQWKITVPVATHFEADTNREEIQTGTAFNGLYCAVTGNGISPLDTSSHYDVDGGRTTLLSPQIDLRKYTEPVVVYRRWYTNNTGRSANNDSWDVQVASGIQVWYYIERTRRSDRKWTRVAFKVADHLQNDSTFQIRFRATDSGADSEVEAAIDFVEIYDALVSSSKPLGSLDLKLSPNPARELLYINGLEANTSYDLLLMDALGREVKQDNSNGSSRISISLEGLSEGLYFVKVSSNKGRWTGSFIKE